MRYSQFAYHHNVTCRISISYQNIINVNVDCVCVFCAGKAVSKSVESSQQFRLQQQTDSDTTSQASNECQICCD